MKVSVLPCLLICLGLDYGYGGNVPMTMMAGENPAPVHSCHVSCEGIRFLKNRYLC